MVKRACSVWGVLFGFVVFFLNYFPSVIQFSGE